MLKKSFETPVAMLVFNRPESTRKVFDAIAKAQPAKLLLVADGPRPGEPGEAEACRQVREIVTRVDWPCVVSTNFAEQNLGCQQRVVTGLNWVFSLVEEAIILEDDCLPDPSFFPYCQELLERYRGDSRIAYIAGTNLMQKHVKTDASYYFSQLGGIWGWATWRSAWQRYDQHLHDWPQLKSQGMLSEIFDRQLTVDHWTEAFDGMYNKTGPDTWDIQWLYTCLKNNSLIIVPNVNLIANIGFGPDATHTTGTDARYTPPSAAVNFPLRHPLSFVPSRSMDQHLQDLYDIPVFPRIKRKIRRIAKRLIHSFSGKSSK